MSLYITIKQIQVLYNAIYVCMHVCMQLCKDNQKYLNSKSVQICYFHILLFSFYPAYLRYLYFLGVNFHHLLCSCLVQSIHCSLHVLICTWYTRHTIAWSSEDPSAFTNFPPTFTLSSESCSASRTSSSIYRLNRIYDSGHPCLAPLPIDPGSINHRCKKRVL